VSEQYVCFCDEKQVILWSQINFMQKLSNKN